MKNLEEILDKYFESGNTADLPDITKENFLRVNSDEDGYHSIKRGGHLYVIEKDGEDYNIYHVHSSQYNVTTRGKKHEPIKVDGFYRDDVPVVFSNGDTIVFEQRDTRSSFDILRNVDTLKNPEGRDKLYTVLQTFIAYAKSVYKFSKAYKSLYVPPVEIGSNEVTEPVDAGQGSNSSSANSSSSAGSNGSESNGSDANSSAGSNASEANSQPAN